MGCFVGCGWGQNVYHDADQVVDVVTTLFLDIRNQYDRIYNNIYIQKDLKL
jgi:hypothetical protein